MCAVQAEKQLSEMVVGKALEAKIDRPAGVVRWGWLQMLGTKAFVKLSSGAGVVPAVSSLVCVEHTAGVMSLQCYLAAKFRVL